MKENSNSYKSAIGSQVPPPISQERHLVVDVGSARQGFKGKVIRERTRHETSQAGSTQVGSTSMYQLYDRVTPRIPFRKRAEFYLSIGRVQNVVENYKLNIINREWYFDDDTNGANQNAVEVMEAWEEQIGLTDILADMIMNWVVMGVHIISPPGS